MRYAVVVMHYSDVSGPGYRARIVGRRQRLWFRWWELRALFRCWRSARRLYGPKHVRLERW